MVVWVTKNGNGRFMALHLDLLDMDITYAGEGISLRGLEDSITNERRRQDVQIEELSHLRSRNTELQSALSEEMERLRNLSTELQRSREGKQSRLAEMFSWLPWVKSTTQTRQSIEELLRRQYEMSSVRLRQAADFADRLEVALVDLHDEVDRMNRKIVEAAQNEEAAAEFVVKLRDLKNDLEFEIAQAEPSSAASREMVSQLDRTRRLLAEHTTKLKLYSTAEERLETLKRNTRQLADTIGHLQSDITRYVTAASEKMDLIAGQIQAIGAAADAANVMLELKHSLDAMTESINYTTRFVADTQQYFRDNVDSMVDDLRLYDSETERVLNRNHLFNESLDDLDVEGALAGVLAQEIDALGVPEEEVVLNFPQTQKVDA